MKTYEIREFGIDKLTQVELDRPAPGRGEVLVKLYAASLNFRDVMVASGTYNPRMKLPAIPLSDAAGEIVEIGANVTKWTVGDRVCSCVIPGWTTGGPTAESARTAIGAGGLTGVAREYAIFNEDAIVAAPETLSFDEAATLPCAALTAWHALAVSGNVQPGETVLTLGTGGVSVFAVQFAKAMGARVIATSSSDKKLDRIRELGADETINYKTTSDWDKTVLELTDGRGVDHVVEVGGSGTLSRSIKSVRTGGHIALIGALDMTGEFNPIPIFMKGIRVQGIFVGSREMFEDMNAFVSKHDIRPVIDRTFGFDELPDALHYMENGSHFGKIVIGYQ
jgi:NADPH:quinone reductase-like Zn-dependent oxidoreductase